MRLRQRMEKLEHAEPSERFRSSGVSVSFDESSPNCVTANVDFHGGRGIHMEFAWEGEATETLEEFKNRIVSSWAGEAKE